jgi:glucosamine-phosphate N-acetyltransferase
MNETSKISIRPSRIEDFDAVVSLLRQLWPDKPLNPASLRIIFDSALVSDTKAYLCAIDGKCVIGFGSLTIKNNLWPEGHLGYIDELVVDSEYRNKGVGTQLLEQLVVLARQKGCCRIELDSAFYRKESHHFYEQHGFEKRAYVFSKIL